MTTAKPTDPPRQPVASDKAAKEQEERNKTAHENVTQGYGNDRAADNQSGVGSQGGARDNTSGRHSGNQ